MIVEAGQSGSVSGEVVVGTGQTISVSTGATQDKVIFRV